MDKAIIDEARTQLVTIRDLVRFLTSRFTAAELYFGHGTDNPWDEAVALITHVLHLPPDADNKISDCRLLDSEKSEILELARRRIDERMPLPYLTHRAWFAGLEFYIDERVLIPRSPMAELLAANLEPYVNLAPRRILDMCTGSGCIAVAAAVTFPYAEVDAVDISHEALVVAEENIDRHRLSDRVFPLPSDLFDELPAEIYDVILANPPYVEDGEMDELPPEYQYEPALALAAGEDGLDLVRRLLREAPHHLTEHGVLFCEVGASWPNMEQAFPDIPFHWVQFNRGGDGVFVMTRAELMRYADHFE
ncbi:MAG: 50S ribosomal protein L3 N(5)-glutamine methyltransferase [Gammaproteobacteria bacterium]|nr:50S ribosomal protein L3 N(5)-glutamine methyltransferase [Gammaproteobacteria bacterium]